MHVLKKKMHVLQIRNSTVGILLNLQLLGFKINVTKIEELCLKVSSFFPHRTVHCYVMIHSITKHLLNTNYIQGSAYDNTKICIHITFSLIGTIQYITISYRYSILGYYLYNSTCN